MATVAVRSSALWIGTPCASRSPSDSLLVVGVSWMLSICPVRTAVSPLFSAIGRRNGTDAVLQTRLDPGRDRGLAPHQPRIVWSILSRCKQRGKMSVESSNMISSNGRSHECRIGDQSEALQKKAGRLATSLHRPLGMQYCSCADPGSGKVVHRSARTGYWNGISISHRAPVKGLDAPPTVIKAHGGKNDRGSSRSSRSSGRDWVWWVIPPQDWLTPLRKTASSRLRTKVAQANARSCSASGNTESRR